MSKLFYGSATVLFVNDLNRSLDFYCDKLGFSRPKLWGNPPGFAMPSREDMTLMLSQVDDVKSIVPKKTIWDVLLGGRRSSSLQGVYGKRGDIWSGVDA